jgi:MFS family permease
VSAATQTSAAVRPKRERVDTRFLLLVAVLFFGFAGFGASLALLPSRIDQLGRGDVALGVAAGVFSVAAIISRLLGGYMVDHVGAKASMAASLLCAAAGGALFLAPGIGGVIAARSVQGIADAVMYVAVAAAALDMVPEERRSQALGWLSGGLWAGLSSGAAITSFVDDARVMGVVTAILAIGSLAIVAVLPSRSAHAADTPQPTGPRWRAMLAPEAYRPGLVLGFTNLGYAAFTGFAVRFAADRFDHANLVLTAFAVMLLFSRAVLGFLVDRMPARLALDLGHALLAVGLIVVAFSQVFWLAIAGAILAAMGHSLPWPVLATSTLEQVGPERRGAVIGTMSASFDAMVALALFGFGVVSDRLGTGSVFIVAVGGVAVANALSRTIRSGRLAARSPRSATAGVAT